jgi:hypothetical protein
MSTLKQPIGRQKSLQVVEHNIVFVVHKYHAFITFERRKNYPTKPRITIQTLNSLKRKDTQIYFFHFKVKC